MLSSLQALTRYLWILCLLWQVSAANADGNGSRGVFWEVSSASNTVYLLGSIHFAKPELYPLSEQVEKAFEQAEVLALEVSTADMQAAGFQQQLLEQGFYPPGSNLLDDISEDTYKLLRESLRAYGLPAEEFLRMKPGILAMTLASVQMQAMGYSPDFGIDRYFEQRALGGKRIVSLESAQEQLAMLIELPNPDGFLRYSLLDLQQAEQVVEPMMQAWQRGDVAALQAIVLESFAEDDQFDAVLDKLFYERNARMADGVAKFLQGSAPHFVVVGAGHLLGDRGVIEMLRARGFIIRAQALAGVAE